MGYVGPTYEWYVPHIPYKRVGAIVVTIVSVFSKFEYFTAIKS